MARDLILGTAGHIDHGKTSLVHALTGVNTDRLPEEKARGITIDIGFAQLQLPNGKLGIVDVPGHERFIKNMLAGASGIDVALLVIAGDDSIMPQTREHFEILKLLQLQHGIIAITKSDTIDDTTRAVVELEIRELVEGSFLADAPIVATSAKTGMGIDELRSTLAEVAATITRSEEFAPFRMAIDRAFVVQGHGTVVTGSVMSGRLNVGDEVDWHRYDGTPQRVRIRKLNSHGNAVEQIQRGQRAACNLAGVDLEHVTRGQELATPGSLQPSRVVTARVRSLPSMNRPLKHRLEVRLHIATREVLASISILDNNVIAPGESALVQLFLDEPIVATWGQPFVLRDSSATQTLGGGQILQPSAIKLRRRHLQSIEQLERLEKDVPTRIAAAAWFAGFDGIDADDFQRLTGSANVEPILRTLQQSGVLVAFLVHSQRSLILHKDRVIEMEQQLLNRLRQLHDEHPLMTNHDRQSVIAQLDYLGNTALMQLVIDTMIRNKLLVGDAKRMARKDFQPKLSHNQRKLKDRIVADYQSSGLEPPDVVSYRNHAGGNAKALDDIFEVACAEGLLTRISPGVYLHAEVEAKLRDDVTNALRDRGEMTVAEIRDLLGTTRKYAVPICEYLDRVRVTHRRGDARCLAVDS